MDNGAAKVDTLAANTELSGSSALVDLGPEYAQQYGFTNPFTDFRNSNLSAHFPYAAQIWKAMWAHDSGMSVDGVIALDPVALSYVLGAVGPVTMPDGEVITEGNVIELTESTAYQRFPDDAVARKGPRVREVGYWLHPDARGRGLMADALRTLVGAGTGAQEFIVLERTLLLFVHGYNNTTSDAILRLTQFVEVAAVVDVEFAKGVGESENLLLLELGILPGRALLARAFRQL